MVGDGAGRGAESHEETQTINTQGTKSRGERHRLWSHKNLGLSLSSASYQPPLASEANLQNGALSPSERDTMRRKWAEAQLGWVSGLAQCKHSSVVIAMMMVRIGSGPTVHASGSVVAVLHTFSYH